MTLYGRDIVSTGILERSSSMKRDVRDIQKQFRLTDEEGKQILALMRERGDTNFQIFSVKGFTLL